MSMLKSSSGPIDSAWAFLKAPEEGLDERMLAQIFQNAPSHLQEKASVISQVMGQMEPEQSSRLERWANSLLEAHGLENILAQSHSLKDPSMVRRSHLTNIIYEGRIAKFVLMTIGVVLVADALLRSQGQKQSFIGYTFDSMAHHYAPEVFDKPNLADTVDFSSEAGYIDPLGKKHDVEDANFVEKIGLGLASGASAAANPFGLVGGIGRTVGRGVARVGSKALGKVGAGRTTRLADKAGAKARDKAISEAAEAHFPMSQAAQEQAYQAGAAGAKPGWLTSRADDLAEMGRYDPALGRGFAGRSKLWDTTGRAIQIGSSAGIPELISGGLAAWGASNMPHVAPSTSGYVDPTHSGFAGANVGGTSGGSALDSHIGGVHNVHSVGPRDKSIWQHAAGQGSTWHGGAATAKGDNMKIGERMLKDVTELMYKAATCPCGKTPCICKEYKSKGDDKKKPAHGMVIVIGTKAGPGPSTDGKRDKLDSEKDEKDE